MRRFIPFVGDTRARDAVDEIFSRDVLGAILFGAAIGKVIEKGLNLIADGTATLLVGWSFAAIVFFGVFVFWHRIEEAASDTKDNVEEAASDSMGDTNRGVFGRVGGFLSNIPEWHALAIGSALGLISGFTGSNEIAIFAFLVITGKAKVSNGHLRDAAKEAAYSGGAFVVLFLIGAVASGAV